MNAAGLARVRACFENGIEVLPIIVPESLHASLQGSSPGTLPQMPQMPQPPTPARREMTDEEDASEERVAIIEHGGGLPRPLAEFLARRCRG